MKIINNNDCYVQMNDILYLIRNSNCFPMQMYYDIVNRYGENIPLNQFVKIEEDEYKNFIKNNKSIFSLSFLLSKNSYELDEFCDEIKANSNLVCSSLTSDFSKYKKNRQNNIMFRLSISEEKLNRNYLLSQIKEARLLKLGKSNIEYPIECNQLMFKKKLRFILNFFS